MKKITAKKNTLKLGKLEAPFLNSLITKLPKLDSTVIIPPGVGLDAAGIKIGEKLIAVTSDPITFSTKNIGTYSVAVNINDVVCLGCTPKYYLGCLLLPEGTTKKTVTSIWHNLSQELKHYNINAIGGHVEVTNTVNTPILIGQMIGTAINKNLLTPQNAKAGDQILLWRNIAIEGTALLANERYDYLKNFLPSRELKKMQKLLHKPGICIWPDIKEIITAKEVIALHDITEGGIATALHELADATNCGLKINEASISIMDATKKICSIFKIDPLGLLASGSVLIICRKNSAQKLLKKINDPELKLIGELTATKKRFLFENNKKRPLPRYAADEITRAL